MQLFALWVSKHAIVSMKRLKLHEYFVQVLQYYSTFLLTEFAPEVGGVSANVAQNDAIHAKRIIE